MKERWPVCVPYRSPLCFLLRPAQQPGLNFQLGEGGCSSGVPAPTSELGRDGLGEMCSFTTGENEEQYMRT